MHVSIYSIVVKNEIFDNKYMKNEKLSRALMIIYENMKAERAMMGFGRKLEACSYMRHRLDSQTRLVPDIITHDSVCIGYLDTIADGTVSAVMPVNDYWFKFTMWGSSSTKRRKEKSLDTTKNKLLKKQEAANRIAKCDYLAVDEVSGALDYFEDVSQKVLSVFSKNGYYREKNLQIRDGFVLGYGLMATYENVETGKVYFKCLDPLECCLGLNESGELERFTREYLVTSYDLLSKFGVNNLPEKVLDNLKSGHNVTYRMLEYIGKKGFLFDPNTGFLVSGADYGKEYEHFLMFLDGDCSEEFLEVNGFDSMPISLWNYRTATSGAYGIGLVEKHLDDVKKLDDFERRRHSIIQYADNPAWAVPMSLQGRFSVTQGSVVTVPDKNSIPQPIEKTNNNSYAMQMEAIADQRNKLRELFFVDLFKTMWSGYNSTDSRKTATEVSIKKSESSQLLTQQIGNLESVVSEEVIRTFHLLRASGKILKSNENVEAFLTSGEMRIEFDSVFIQRMRSYYMVEGNSSILNMVQILFQVYPDLALTINFDRLTRMLATGLGASQYAIYEQSETEQFRAEKAEQQRQQMELEQQMQQSQTNSNNAKAMQSQAQAQQFQM